MPLPNNCPLCSAKNEHQSVVTPHVYGDEQKKHAFFKCAVCDMNYLYPQLTPQEETRFYNKEFEGFMASRSGEKAGWEGPEKHIKANQVQFDRRWKYLQHYLPASGSVLELGCSSGFMLYPLKDKGYECFGVEPSGYFSQYVRERGIQVYDDISKVDRTFDVVMHSFVLEHVRDPVGFLNAGLGALNKGGKLIVEIPNGADPLYTIYEVPAFERFYWSIAHYWYFTEKALQHVLNQLSGVHCEILRDQRYDLSNHMVWARDGRPGGMGRFTDKLGQAAEDAYRQALIDSGYCDTLIAVITKE